MTGITQSRSSEDEKMLRCIGETNPNTHKVHIYDARPYINAVANKVG
jgi:myotubularin-related protein 1/2